MRHLARSLMQILHPRYLSTLTIVVLSGLAMCCMSAYAQTGAGSIQGTVTDSTGAVVPGASIHVVQQGTGATFDSKSSRVGFYQVPGLFTATYTVTVSAPGFKTYKTSLELLVAQNAVINPTLTAGAVTSTVQVAANSVQLTTTDNGTISSTLESQRINQLPMNGRELTFLVGETTPGLESGNSGADGTAYGQRANGLESEALEYVADGATLTGREFGGMKMAHAQGPDPDSVQEVSVLTSDASAEYATPGTAIITTKSGTDSLHGALFETARNNAIGIAKSRSNPANYAAPHLVRNEFGGSLGGPIVLPHLYHGKDKSFFFFSYMRYSLASYTYENVTVPTVAMRGGDFSGLINSSGVLQTLYDPATTYNATTVCPATGAPNPYCRSQFNYNGPNTINPNRLSPATKIINDITPLPNSAANPLITTNLQAPNIDNATMPSIVIRLDHIFNENNRMYFRYGDNLETIETLRNSPTQPATIAADGFPAGASGISYDPTATFPVSVGYTHVFSPTFFSETVVSQQWFDEKNYAGGDPNLDYDNMLGLPNNFGEKGFPNWGESGLIYSPSGTMFTYGMNQIIQDIDENLTKTKGNHQLQFGGRYRHERFGDEPDQSSDRAQFDGYGTGLYDTSTGSTYGALANTGNENGDDFLGDVSEYGVVEEPPYAHYHDMEFDAYFQDNWHASRNLTVNLGLRYENHPAPWTKYNLTTGIDWNNHAMVLGASPQELIWDGVTTQAIITNDENIGVKFESAQQAGLPANTLINNYPFNFGPRVGIAYQPFGGQHGTVIRAGYGRYIYPVPTRSILKSEQNNNPFDIHYYQNYDSASQSPDGITHYLLRNNQPTIAGVNSVNAVNTNVVNAITPGISPWSVNPRMPPDYVSETNFTIEQALKGNSALRLTWLYTHGTNLDQDYNYNAAYSQYSWEMLTGTVPPQGGASVIGTPQANTYSSTALDVWDQIWVGSGALQAQKTGWSNDNALQVNYERLFHHGIAYQIMYVWSKPFRVGGNYISDSELYPSGVYTTSGLGNMLPDYGAVTPLVPLPAKPAGIGSYQDWHALNRYEDYIVDTAIPKQHIQFNGIVDLPFGTGKRFFGNANHFLNEVVGGFQVAGDGQVVSQDFPVTATNWGPTNPLHVYKSKAKITDCRSGVCYPEREWFNGYLAPTVTSGVTGSTCTKNCVTGLPGSWTPYQTPIDNTPGTKYYGSNEVDIQLLNGSIMPNTYAPGPSTSGTAAIGNNPFSHTILNGPMNYNADLSVFKVFPITERTRLRFNADAFNALNIQGYNNPSGTDGTENFRSSYWTPRQLQFTLRLEY